MKGYEYILRNVETVRERMARACDVAGRSADDVALCAVVKMRTPEEIAAVLEAGVGIIGENRVREAADRAPFLKGGFEYHFIGHVQTNKAAQVAEMFGTVQSVDSQRVAESLSREAGKRNKTLAIYLQVNSSGEETKSGLESGEFMEAAERISVLDHLALRGVMTIGPLTDDEAAIRKSFKMTRELYEALKKHHPGASVLSMGMTDDLEIAIQEGATLLRVGRALFERR